MATEWKDKSYAGVHPKDGEAVPGVLVKIDSLSLMYLDILEWCVFGAYERVLKKVRVGDEVYKAWIYIVKYPDMERVSSTLYLNNMIKGASDREFPKEYIEFLKTHEHRSHFVIDHSFSLLTYRCTRKYIKQLYLFYKVHDYIRNKLCEFI